ncbi:hypothetical protein ACGFYV_33260 [Streptomyces sp. NPDC048297]
MANDLTTAYDNGTSGTTTAAALQISYGTLVLPPDVVRAARPGWW